MTPEHGNDDPDVADMLPTETTVGGEPSDDGDRLDQPIELESEPVDLPTITFERQSLSPSVRWVWFVGYLMPILVVTVIVLQLDIFVFPTRTGLATSAAMIALLAFSVWRTVTRYRNWSWELDETELIIDRGVVFKLTRIIPRIRVQHVDLSSGPVDRLFDLRQLSIYTAGTREADASIPGLTAGRAEELRQALIARQ